MMNGNGFDSTNGRGGRNRRFSDDAAVPGGDAEAIQDRMAILRRGLQQDAVQLAHTARQATDWKFYVEKFPLACAGVALVLGYTLIPAKKGPLVASEEQLAKLAKSGQLKVVAEAPATSKQGLARKAMFALGGLALRAALDHLGQSVGPLAAARQSPGHPRQAREV